MQGPAKLGDVAKRFIEGIVSPRQAKFAPVAEIWCQLLPDELNRHCRIADISGGHLKVVVDSSSYLYELQLCSSELLKELKQRCPRARIKDIKFTVG